VVVDAALADVRERGLDRATRRLIGKAQGTTPQQPKEAPLRKLGRAGQSAVAGIDGTNHAGGEIGEQPVGDGDAGPRAALLQRRHQQLGVVAHLLGLFAIDARHLAQHVGKGGPAEARLWRKIGATPERPRRAVEEHGQRPAAGLAEVVQRAHVEGVDVGALLAIDLDVDE